MKRKSEPQEKREAARRLRDDWVAMGVQLDLLSERRDNTLREAERLEREAEDEARRAWLLKQHNAAY